jgi:hypothetical protein
MQTEAPLRGASVIFPKKLSPFSRSAITQATHTLPTYFPPEIEIFLQIARAKAHLKFAATALLGNQSGLFWFCIVSRKIARSIKCRDKEKR